ncbi:MAG: MMPL family transporter [Candidatus Hodarchaeota archaeon]
MASLGPFVRKYKIPIILIWIAFLALSIPFALDLRNKTEASDVLFLENSESEEADDYIAEHFDLYATDELLLIIVSKNLNATIIDNEMVRLELAALSQSDELSNDISITSIYTIEAGLLFFYNLELDRWINNTLKEETQDLLGYAFELTYNLTQEGYPASQVAQFVQGNVTIAIQTLLQELELPEYFPTIPFSFEEIADFESILPTLLAAATSGVYNRTNPPIQLINDTTTSICANATILVMQTVPPPSLASGTFPNGLLRQYISDDGRAMLVMFESDEAWTAQSVREVREGIHSELKSLEEEYEYFLTGEPAIKFELQEYINEDVEKIDRVTIALVLILLTLIFLSVVAPAVPVITIGMALICGHTVIWVFAQTTDVPTLMLSICTVVAFGAGVDYIIFILNRYREERLAGKNEEEAIDLAIHRSGESVLSSGMTVMVGFGSLILSSFIFLRFMGLGPLVSIVFALLAALTFIPVMMAFLGDKLFWPTKLDKQPNAASWTQKLWNKAYLPDLEAMGRFIVRHPKKVILALLILSIPLLFQATKLERNYDVANNLPSGAESTTGLKLVSTHFSEGRVTPIEVLVQFNEPINNDAFYYIEVLDTIESLSSSIDGLSYVGSIHTVTRPFGNLMPYNEQLDPINTSAMAAFVSDDNQRVLMSIALSISPMSNEGFDHLEEIQTILNEEAESHLNISRLLFGGSPSGYKEMADMLYKEEPLMILFVLVGIFIVLLLLLRSIFTPIRLELTIIFSVFVTLGATQFVFVELLGESVPWIVPIMLFVVLFGLGMDYDIFLVTRMKEEVQKGASDEEAIIIALSKTGKIIAACGIIMAFALGTLIISSNQILKVLGFAFFFAILLDAFIIRLLLVPAIMMVFGRYNWWLPFYNHRFPSKSETAGHENKSE